MEENVQKYMFRDHSVERVARLDSITSIAGNCIVRIVRIPRRNIVHAKSHGKYASEKSKAIKEMAKHLDVSDMQVDALNQLVERTPEVVSANRIRARKSEYLNHKIPNHENDEIV